jgi:hypothetical protein
MNLIVNSESACTPVEHVWSEEELSAGLESFEAALVLWRNEKNYDPRKKEEPRNTLNTRNGGRQPGPVLVAGI